MKRAASPPREVRRPALFRGAHAFLEVLGGEQQGLLGHQLLMVSGSDVHGTPITVKARGAGSAWVGPELAEGATVIVYPPAGLRDGARVTVRQV